MRKTLILEELCSDMSHQARTYNDADLKLIREHPDIFPNFYAIPTPHLGPCRAPRTLGICFDWVSPDAAGFGGN
jgi:hypothetical protein